jgi:hypothetical protein
MFDAECLGNIAERSGIPFASIKDEADLLCRHSLLSVVKPEAARPAGQGEA